MKGDIGANGRLVKQVFTEKIAGKCLRTEIRLSTALTLLPLRLTTQELAESGIGIRKGPVEEFPT